MDLETRKLIIWNTSKRWNILIIMQTKSTNRIEILFVYVGHGYEEFN
jgi:hypothetical protein